MPELNLKKEVILSHPKSELNSCMKEVVLYPNSTSYKQRCPMSELNLKKVVIITLRAQFLHEAENPLVSGFSDLLCNSHRLD
ncbi:hypothetical protein LWI29_019656 [Acer saccharum]|uniref:Uncharacterized protein n=1 Tax=Acer saccharum TaxID=4024 RepID=A0AA39VGA0_ACESA|nr:hypothetical protein LWI29_019656 [Acer saccharum]